MAVIENVIVPILQLSAYTFMILGISFVVYKLTKKSFQKWALKLKYSILRRKYRDEDVSLCLMALENDLDSIELKRRLLLKGLKPKRVREILFIYEMVKKKHIRNQ